MFAQQVHGSQVQFQCHAASGPGMSSDNEAPRYIVHVLERSYCKATATPNTATLL